MIFTDRNYTTRYTSQQLKLWVTTNKYRRKEKRKDYSSQYKGINDRVLNYIEIYLRWSNTYSREDKIWWMFRLWSVGHQPTCTLEPPPNFNHFNPVDGDKISLLHPPTRLHGIKTRKATVHAMRNSVLQNSNYKCKNLLNITCDVVMVNVMEATK